MQSCSDERLFLCPNIARELPPVSHRGNSVFIGHCFNIIIFMHKAAVAQLFQICIPDIKTCFCAFSAYEKAQAVLGIGVDQPQAFVGGDDRKKPIAPAKLAFFRAFQKLAVENAYKCSGCFLAADMVFSAPSVKRPCFAAHFPFEL